jgi:hypothetical protein
MAPGSFPAPCWRAARAQRKPWLSFRFSGLFLFRFAERRFLGSFLKEPPRTTRCNSEVGYSPTLQV